MDISFGWDSGIRKFRYRLPHGIKAPGMKGMAPTQAAEAHPNAPQSAVTRHCLAHILRAGRIETAGRGQQRGNGKLIGAQGPH